MVWSKFTMPRQPINTNKKVLFLQMALVALLVGLFYHPLWNLNCVQSGGDAVNLFLPLKVLVSQSLWGDGVVPLWNHYSYLGCPLAASLQHAVFYPIDWVLYSLLPAHTGMNFSNLFHLMLAGVGTFLWLRVGHRQSGWAAVACGVAFPCCSWFWGHQEHINQIAAISWLPLQALICWLFLKERLDSRRFFLSYSMISLFQFLAGHPQEAFYAHFFCGLLVLGYIIGHGNLKENLKRFVPTFVLTGFVVGLLVSVQLLMTLELASHSRRQIPDPYYAISFSLPPDVAITQIFPHEFGSYRKGFYTTNEAGEVAMDWRAYGEYGQFLGLPILLLALLALVAERSARRFLLFLLAMAILFYLFALGGNTDLRRVFSLQFTENPEPGWSLYEVFLKIFPPAQGFRVPGRILSLYCFTLVTMAAFGFAWILEIAQKQRKKSIAGLAIGIGIFVGLYIPSRKEKFHQPLDISLLPYNEPISCDAKDVFPGRTFRLTISDDQRLMDERLYDPDRTGISSIGSRLMCLQPHLNAGVQMGIVGGYEEGLVPTLRYFDFQNEFNRNLRQATPDPILLNLLGVNSVLADLPVMMDGEVENLGNGWRRHGRGDAAWGIAFQKAMADGIDLKRLDGPLFREGIPRGDRNNEVIVLGNPAIATQPNAQPLRVQYSTANSVDISIPEGSVPQDALLTMSWYPGWVVGKDQAPLQWENTVNATLPAEELSTAHWLVSFQPYSYRLGLFLTAIGMMIWGGVLGFVMRKKQLLPFKN
jgi:hypothetical protein